MGHDWRRFKRRRALCLALSLVFVNRISDETIRPEMTLCRSRPAPEVLPERGCSCIRCTKMYHGAA